MYARLRIPLMAASLALGCARRDPQDLAEVKLEIARRYPRVPHISVSELADGLAGNPGPILLDAREQEEFAVSHLELARRAITIEQAVRVLNGTDRGAHIVAYCSVGYRSAALTDQLVERGYTNTFNLEGSIFEWANRGYPLYRGTQQVQVVHPYDEEWGRLLDKRLWGRVGK